MIDFLNALDTQLFLFLNGIHSVFFDEFMFTFSGKWVWLPFYASLLYLFIRIWKKDSIWIILALVLCIVFADQIASGILKVWVQRPRPSRAEELDGLVHIVNGYRAGKYGFVSSHASNSFGLALFCSLLFRKNKTYAWVLFAWAVLTAYSRIYLGVHYPGDILGGILVGVFAALFCLFLLKKFRLAFLPYELHSTGSFLQKQENYLPLWVILLTTVGIAIYSFAAM